MLKELLDTQRSLINAFFDDLDLQDVEKVLKALLDCKGVIAFTGIGKSGIIAQKIAATMVSVDVKAVYLPATDTLHGDLGMVSKGDIMVLLSKSGETDELLNLIPYVRNKQVKTIAVVSKDNSRLSQACDMDIVLPLQRELCPFDLAPTTSTAIQLIFGDVLAVAMMRSRNFSLDEYALNHPAGRIGKRITVRVNDLMITGENVPRCSPNSKLVDVLVELSNKKCGCLLIVDEKDALQGIFTDGDLRRSLQTEGPEALQKPVGSLMSQSPKTTSKDVLAWEAMRLMESNQQHPVQVLPVIEKEQVIGILKMHDILQSGL